ncbi:MAG: hypothetical protein R3C04_10705 [Hyphomonas sp.]
MTLSRADKFVNFYQRIGRAAFLSVADDPRLPQLFHPGMTGVDPESLLQLRNQSKRELQQLRELVLTTIG